MSYWNNGPTSNREAMSEIDYMNWREHQNRIWRIRHNALAKRKSLARNALAAQMVTTGRGPKPPGHLPPPLPLTKLPAPRPNLNAEPYVMNNLTRNILAMLSNVPAPAPAPTPAPVGGAGSGPAAAPAASPARYENTSHFTALPNTVRSKIASYLSGAERNHLIPIKAKIARETAKIANPRKRKNKTRKH